MQLGLISTEFQVDIVFSILNLSDVVIALPSIVGHISAISERLALLNEAHTERSFKLIRLPFRLNTTILQPDLYQPS